MITAAERELTSAGVDAKPGVVLADAGYWSNDHNRLAARARDHPDRRRRHHPRPAAKNETRRTLRLRAQGDGHQGRRRALFQAPVHGRARLCPDQDEPSDRPPQTKRPGGRPLGMAPDRDHPQPLEALPAHAGSRDALIGAKKAPCHSRPRRFQHRAAPDPGAFARQPPSRATVSLGWTEMPACPSEQERRSRPGIVLLRTFSCAPGGGHRGSPPADGGAWVRPLRPCAVSLVREFAHERMLRWSSRRVHAWMPPRRPTGCGSSSCSSI